MFTHGASDSVFYGFFSLSQEIYKDRKKFSRQVFEVASSDLVNMGITVVSYTLKDVRDDMVRTAFAACCAAKHADPAAFSCADRIRPREL